MQTDLSCFMFRLDTILAPSFLQCYPLISILFHKIITIWRLNELGILVECHLCSTSYWVQARLSGLLRTKHAQIDQKQISAFKKTSNLPIAGSFCNTFVCTLNPDFQHCCLSSTLNVPVRPFPRSLASSFFHA